MTYILVAQWTVTVINFFQAQTWLGSRLYTLACLQGGSLYTRESSKPDKSGRHIGRVSGRSGTSDKVRGKGGKGEEGKNRLPENP